MIHFRKKGGKENGMDTIRFGKFIREMRKEKGLTQKQLADKTGIAQSDISKLETGNANPSLKTLQRLASGMGMVLRIEFLPADA